MPTIAINQTKPSYDVIVIGSGATGAQAAYTLTLEGVKVLMLEAGRDYDLVAETPMFQTGKDAPLRAAGTPDKSEGFYNASIQTDPVAEPYTNAKPVGEAGREVRWFRTRMLGGRTNHWGKVSLRPGPDDFRLKTLHGVGFDWPIAYEDLAPYLDKVEMLVGVFGDNDGVDNAPDSSPGVLLPPPPMKVGELYAKKHVQALGIRVVASRRAVLSKRLDHETVPARLHPNNPAAQKLVAQSMQARQPCFWATPCARGCTIKATHQSTAVQLPPALASGNLDIVCDVMAREITLDRSGKADGVVYIDRKTGQEHKAVARAVVVAASAYESVRLLMNSKSSLWPQGLGNTNGLLGKNITTTVHSGFLGQIPALENLPPLNEDGAGSSHAYIPWWLAADQRAGKLEFVSGYHINLTTGPEMPTGARNIGWLTKGSYGKRYREDQRRYYGSFFRMLANAAMTPNDDSYVDLDPTVKDKWGLPVIRFHWKWSELDARAAVHAQKSMAAIIDAMGGRVQRPPSTDGYAALNAPIGHHEVGGAMMGSDRATSITNPYGQLWDVKNVMLVDGSVFPTTPHKNPTLALMAIAWRNADQLVEALRTGSF